MKFHEAAKYYYYPGMHEPGSMLACGVNKSWFTSLSKEDQTIIKTACAWADEITMSEYNAKNGAPFLALYSDIVISSAQAQAVLIMVWSSLDKLVNQDLLTPHANIEPGSCIPG